jgi:shikimate dehydrogenase
MTKKYGILAHPAKHSLSPAMFDAAFKEAGIDAEYRVYDIRENELQKFMEKTVRHDPVSGLSVSLPYKESVMGFLDVVDEDAKRIGAVNTIVNKGGYLYGSSTDHLGVVAALKAKCGSLKGKRVMVMGAGGAARAIIYGLLKVGAEVLIVNRNMNRAEELVTEFTEIFGPSLCACYFDDKKNVNEADILIQATSIWMLEPKLPEPEVNFFVPDEFVEKFEYVMDIVYQPLKTPLIEKAERLGKKVITGEKMLLHQAVEQYKLWFEEEAPVKAMREVLEKSL